MLWSEIVNQLKKLNQIFLDGNGAYPPMSLTRLIPSGAFIMSKRFFDTTKYDDPWFRNLEPKYKCFWEFLLSKCDNSGVWKKDFELANYSIKTDLDESDTLNALNNGKLRILGLTNGSWLVKDFVNFQYGKLSEDSKPHKSVMNLINKHKEIGYP